MSYIGLYKLLGFNSVCWSPKAPHCRIKISLDSGSVFHSSHHRTHPSPRWRSWFRLIIGHLTNYQTLSDLARHFYCFSHRSGVRDLIFTAPGLEDLWRDLAQSLSVLQSQVALYHLGPGQTVSTWKEGIPESRKQWSPRDDKVFLPTFKMYVNRFILPVALGWWKLKVQFRRGQLSLSSSSKWTWSSLGKVSIKASNGLKFIMKHLLVTNYYHFSPQIDVFP